MTEAGEKKLAIRRAQVQAAVKRWRVKHKEKYNAYTREYLKRPGPHKKHLQRCKRYREGQKRRKLLAAT